MADWFYTDSKAPKWLNDIGQIFANIETLNNAIANMTLAEAVQYIEQKRISGDPIAQQIIKWTENYTDTEETETDTYVIGSVNQGAGGRSGGGGSGRAGDASEVWEDYGDDGGAVSIFGNATETEEAIPYLVLLTRGNILSLGVQLFLPQSIAIASLLPYAGLATTEEFWKESAEQAFEIGAEVLEFTYKGIPIKGLVPAVLDMANQVWLDNAMMEKLKAFVSRTWVSETVNTSSSSYVSDFLPITLSSRVIGYYYYSYPGEHGWRYFDFQVPNGCRMAAFKGNNRIVHISIGGSIDFVGTSYYYRYGEGATLEEAILNANSPSGLRTGTLKRSPTHYGYAEFAYDNPSMGANNIGMSEVEILAGYVNDYVLRSAYSARDEWDYAQTIALGDVITNIAPAGIETRPAFVPTLPYPPVVLKNSGTLGTRQLTPVTISETQPWLTDANDPDTPSTSSAVEHYLWPSVNQNEFVPYDPDEYPSMAYDPESATAPLPTPQNVPATQPIENPSSPGTPEISYNPAIFDPPFSGGTSPAIGVPDPLDWPSAVPGDTSGTHNGDPGLIHVYNPSNTEMQTFGRWLWVTYNDVTLNKIFNNPFDGVIGAHELYATPASVGVKEKIRSGFLVSDVDAYPVLVRYTNINCGSIVIPEYWGNYLDYAPYTKVHVYLPFIGIVELEADDIIGHSVNITYAIDSYTGACIAQITVAKDDYVNTLYEFQGNCAVEVPITGGSQAAIKAGLIAAAAYGISGVIGAIGSGIKGGMTGGAAAGVPGAIGGAVLGAVGGLTETAANAINNVVSLKSSVQHSGTFGSSFGAMGIKKPYIIVKRPIQKVVPGYNQDYGFPAHKQVVIGQCQGYLKVLEINVVSPTATNDEKAQIEALLKQGVYVS